jgi:hypothetical protein
LGRCLQRGSCINWDAGDCPFCAEASLQSAGKHGGLQPRFAGIASTRQSFQLGLGSAYRGVASRLRMPLAKVIGVILAFAFSPQLADWDSISHRVLSLSLGAPALGPV